MQWSSLTGRSRVSSLANLCSDAKDLGFEKSDNQLTLQAAGNTVALVQDRGMKVGNVRHFSTHPHPELLCDTLA